MCTRTVIREFSSLCGTEVYNIEKSYVPTDVAVLTSNWSSDDMLLTPLQLVLVAQYFISPSLMVDSKFVRRHDNYLVVHLMEPAIKRCLKQVLCSFRVRYRYGRLLSSSDISKSTELPKLA